VFTFHDYRRVGSSSEGPSGLIRGPDALDWSLLHRRRGVGCLTVMLKRDAIPMPLFPERAELGEGVIHEDFVAWARMLKDGARARRLSEDLARYRVSASSFSANRLQGARSIWRIYRHTHRIPRMRAVWYFLNYVFFASWVRVLSRLSRAALSSGSSLDGRAPGDGGP
jgi:hypothetical protein